jgi:hypothetical protein
MWWKKELVCSTLLGKQINKKGGYTDGERIPQGTGIDHGKPGIIIGGTKWPANGVAGP